MKSILLLQFRNYFDRRIKRFDSLASYYNYQLGQTFTNINFIPGDGITTELILNFDTEALGSPNYLIAAETSTDFTRWFITETERTRKGQTKFKLRRDLVAEEIQGIKEATAMINKGYVEWGNPAFFNKEPISVNRIPKTREFLIDKSVSGWLVAYLPKSGKGENSWEDTGVAFGTVAPQAQYSFASLDEARTAFGENNAYIGGMLQVYATPSWVVGSSLPKLKKYEYFLQNGGAWPVETVNSTSSQSYFEGTASLAPDAIQAGVTAIYQEVGKRLTPSDLSFKGYQSVVDTVSKYDGATVKNTSTGVIYKVSAEISERSVSDIFIDSWNNSDLNQVFVDAAKKVDGRFSETTGQHDFEHAPIKTSGCTCYFVKVSFTQVSDEIYEWKISKKRRKTEDAPYDCICLPYRTDGINAVFKIDGKLVDVDYNANMSLASSFSTYWGSNVYDVQLLPYCPVQDLIVPGTGGIAVDSTKAGVVYQYDTASKTLVCFCRTINSKFSISKQLIPPKTKTDFLCKHYKLVAPNFSSEYEVPVFENGGVYYWNVTETLIPYSPWIQVVPQFKNFNGADLKDSRGLIVGGSLSITQTTTAWAEYLRSNCNYSQIFESQMAYQEYQQKNSMIASAIGSVGGALTTGVGTGILTGGVALGVGAGLASGAAGVADLLVQNKMNQKANEFAREQRELSLSNIKSTPATISKVTSINSNFCVWPYIEFDVCGDGEYELVDTYLKMYGMTINQVGTLENFMKKDYYCSADILLADNIYGDANYKNQIKSEVSQGFFYEED